MLASLTAMAGLDSSADELAAQNYYERLGLTPAASRKEISVAYHRYRMRHLEEINAVDPAIRERTALMSEAFNALKNESTRAKYNQENQFTMNGLGPEREFFRSTAEPGLGKNASAPALSTEVKAQIAKIGEVKPGALSAKDEKLILSFLDQSELHPLIAGKIAVVLTRSTEWSNGFWQKITDKFFEMRPGQPLYPLVISISKQRNWPPAFRERVEVTLKENAVSTGNLGAEQNARVLAVELLLSRKSEKTMPEVIATIESFLASHHDSDLMAKTVYILEGAKFPRSAKMDALLVASMRDMFLSEANSVTLPGPYANRILQLFLRSNSVPSSTWSMLENELRVAEHINGPMQSIALLAQKFTVPEAVTTEFLKKIAEARNVSALPMAFAKFTDPRYYGFEPGYELAIEKFRCDRQECSAQLVRAARRIIGPFEVMSNATAKLLLRMLRRTMSEHPELMDDPEFSQAVRDVLNNAKSYAALANDTKPVTDLVKRGNQSRHGAPSTPKLNIEINGSVAEPCPTMFSRLVNLLRQKK